MSNHEPEHEQPDTAGRNEPIDPGADDEPTASRLDLGAPGSGGTGAPGSGDESTDRTAGERNSDPPVADERSREELLSALREAEAQRDEYLDDLKRSQAEFQNFRKRSMREGSKEREQGTVDVIQRLIDVLDDFELAVLATDGASDVASLRKGIDMVYGKLVDVLKAYGLEKVGVEGVPFDPELHEAVQQIDDGVDREQPEVVEVLRPGYLVSGKVLRPAMVKVAR